MPVQKDEQIQDLIPKEVPKEVKVPMYYSKYSAVIRKETRRNKQCHQTMGYAEIHLDPPKNYLKKKTRMVRRPNVDKTKLVTERKPPIPSLKVAKGKKKAEKNFKQRNILHAIKSVPKKPTPAFADTKDGSTQKLIPSGLLPQFIFKENYGKIPAYVVQRQKVAIRKEHRAREKEEQKQPLLRYVTEDERQELLDGLKKNWEDLQKEFQLLPMVTDTVPKIKRKTQLEKELKDLEKLIELVERNPVIYVDECDAQYMNRLQGSQNKRLVPAAE